MAFFECSSSSLRYQMEIPKATRTERQSLVTHDERISSYADRILQMKDGRITNEQINHEINRKVPAVEESHA